jgi:acyl-CoA synthetase (AMP-forming)/AMP-acid ligase II
VGDVRGDLQWRSIPNLAREAAARHGDAQAIVFEGESVSYGALWAAALDAGRAFVAAGIEPGDRVAIWAPNLPEWVVGLLGLQAAGAVLVPLNTRFKGTEAADILGRSRARVLLTVQGFLGNDYVSMLDGADLPALEATVVLRGDVPDGCVGWADFVARGSTVEPREIERRVDALGPDDPSDLLYTSGTTGHPKGVQCTHGQTLRAYADWADVIGLRAGDRYLLVNPMFHAFGYKAGIVAAVITGATLVPVPVFDVDTVLDLVPAERITMIPGPPTLYQSLLHHPRLATAELSSLRLAVTGAAVVPVDLVRRMREDLGFDTVITGYGLTEACGIATMCRHDDDVDTIASTSGRAIPGVEVRVVDDTGAEVPRGEPGEVVVRGYNVMSGYVDEPEESAAAVDAEGWLHTGDIGVMDERGYLRVTDRKKDMFIVGGFNAYPAEIEQLLLRHPGVAQAAVVGVPDGRLGEVPVAFVVPVGTPDGTLDGTLDPDEVVVWARAAMANYKVPRRVVVVDELPLNASGKVLKYELREKAAVL